MAESFPKISIVTPSFNQAQFIEATIDSVLSQNYPNLEYIIIDGGSTDGSVEIIKKYSSYLHFWCSEPDRGQYDAINKGFTYSTGEIMAWINSDDMYYPWSFKTVASIMSALPQVEWLTTLNPGAWDWYGFCNEFLSFPGYSQEAFLDGRYLPGSTDRAVGFIQQESTFWRRSLWQKVGSKISTDFAMAGDFNLWSQFYLHADLYGIPSPLAGFRKQIHQKSQRINQYIDEAFNSLKVMRSNLGWSQNTSRNILRNTLLKLKINRIPKLKNITKNTYTYSGKKILRKNSDSPDSFWTVEEYRFFC